jgi:hypothetical protein
VLVHVATSSAGGEAGIVYDTNGIARFMTGVAEMNSGAMEYRIRNAQNNVDSLWVDGSSNTVNVKDIDCDGCVEASDIQKGLQKLIFADCTVHFTNPSGGNAAVDAGEQVWGQCNVPGARVGDTVIVTMQSPTSGAPQYWNILSARVTAENSVRIAVQNALIFCGESGGDPCHGNHSSLPDQKFGVIVFKKS